MTLDPTAAVAITGGAAVAAAAVPTVAAIWVEQSRRSAEDVARTAALRSDRCERRRAVLIEYGVAVAQLWTAIEARDSAARSAATERVDEAEAALAIEVHEQHRIRTAASEAKPGPEPFALAMTQDVGMFPSPWRILLRKYYDACRAELDSATWPT